MYFLPVFSHSNSTTAHIRIYLNERGLDKERIQVTPFPLLLFREAGADRGKCLDSKGNRGALIPLGTDVLVSWRPHGKQQQSSQLLLWRQVLVCATPQCLNKWQCSKLCVAWKTASVFSHGFSAVYLWIGLSYFLHRHLGTSKHWVTALGWTKEVSLALKILVMLVTGGGLSNQAVFQKCLKQDFAFLTQCRKLYCSSMPSTIFINFLPLSLSSGQICTRFMVLMFLLSRVSGRHLFFSPLRRLASLIYLYYVIFKEVLGCSGGNEM